MEGDPVTLFFERHFLRRTDLIGEDVLLGVRAANNVTGFVIAASIQGAVGTFGDAAAELSGTLPDQLCKVAGGRRKTRVRVIVFLVFVVPSCNGISPATIAHGQVFTVGSLCEIILLIQEFSYCAIGFTYLTVLKDASIGPLLSIFGQLCAPFESWSRVLGTELIVELQDFGILGRQG